MTRESKCRDCDITIKWFQDRDTKRWMRLEPADGGPLCIDAKGSLRVAAECGWHGWYRHHRCNTKGE